MEIIRLHQAFEIFNRTESTISAQKFPGLKIWWGPGDDVILDWKGSRVRIPKAAIQIGREKESRS